MNPFNFLEFHRQNKDYGGEFNQMRDGQAYGGNNEYLVYMDFTKAKAWMLKGYMPILGRPS